eukprot:5045323-Amphidinium_carterae.1
MQPYTPKECNASMSVQKHRWLSATSMMFMELGPTQSHLLSPSVPREPVSECQSHFFFMTIDLDVRLLAIGLEALISSMSKASQDQVCSIANAQLGGLHLEAVQRRRLFKASVEVDEELAGEKSVAEDAQDLALLLSTTRLQLSDIVRCMHGPGG